jgi:RNA polymerase sigma-70 factor (ECF subfamily)
MTEVAIREAVANESLVARAAAGDEAAFTRLVAAHHASMARVAYAIVGEVDAADDSVQAAWSVAWRRLRDLRDQGAVGPWLIAIAANEARQTVRSRLRRPVVDLSAVSEPSTGGDPADRIETVDLARVLQRLGADERMLLALRFVGGLESNEIAAHLGLSASGVRSRLSRLLDRLRGELDHA